MEQHRMTFTLNDELYTWVSLGAQVHQESKIAYLKRIIEADMGSADPATKAAYEALRKAQGAE